MIPSGANVFLDSPLTDARSPYGADNNYYLLASTTNGAGPIQTSFGGALPDGTDKLYFAAPNGTKAQLDNLKVGMQVLNTGTDDEIKPGTTILEIHKDGKESTDNYLLLSQPTNQGTNPSGYSLVYKNPLNEYAATDITRLWYSWAKYYVDQYANFPQNVTASASYVQNSANLPQNEFTLDAVPTQPLAVGMTVSGAAWIRPGTTILSITDPNGNFIGSANSIGDKIYLSLLPTSVPTGSQTYTIGAPVPIPYTSTVNTFNPVFATPAEKDKALLFGGSVYAAMSAESAVLQPSPLPPAFALVGQVIQFYANLPTDGITPGGKNLTGQVRDVVKSILRGVWNFVAVPDQKNWYPDPAAAHRRPEIQRLQS